MTMFSTTTMASSITSPTAAASPPRRHEVEAFAQHFSAMKVTCNRDWNHQPATTDVPQSRRKTTRMMEARISPSRIASRTLLMESLTMID